VIENKVALVANRAVKITPHLTSKMTTARGGGFVFAP